MLVRGTLCAQVDRLQAFQDGWPPELVPGDAVRPLARFLLQARVREKPRDRLREGLWRAIDDRAGVLLADDRQVALAREDRRRAARERFERRHRQPLANRWQHEQVGASQQIDLARSAD